MLFFGKTLSLHFLLRFYISTLQTPLPRALCSPPLLEQIASDSAESPRSTCSLLPYYELQDIQGKGR